MVAMIWGDSTNSGKGGVYDGGAGGSKGFERKVERLSETEIVRWWWHSSCRQAGESAAGVLAADAGRGERDMIHGWFFWN